MDRVEQMYQVVKQKILNLELNPIQPIDEKALVRETGGSLTLAQQALEQLAQDGFVVKQRGRWLVSRSATAATMREIFEVRTTLEGMCARLAAERISPEQIQRMEQLLKDFAHVLKTEDNKSLLIVDHQFHGLMYEASGNRFLARALEEMYTLVYRLSFFALDKMGSVRGNVEEHRRILEALKEGDGRSAERLVQQHITHFQSMVEELL
ncbi:MAG: GntR family transcriptional regulator [Anaerolineae bacterium]|nr:GntR family transcriptional regulator [Anaerolineae bacterium]